MQEDEQAKRNVLRDLDITLRDARNNLRGMSKTVTNDLEKVQQASTTGKPASTRAARPRPNAGTAPTRRKATTAIKATTAAKATMTHKPTAAARASKERAEPTAVASEQRPLAAAAAKKETSSALEP